MILKQLHPLILKPDDGLLKIAETISLSIIDKGKDHPITGHQGPRGGVEL
jgi:hypothetical protein